ncbi:hypothetical protein [Thalassovita sp.]|uniref:hypothetical protein n=1 Tax=Thalassovita sp. TaxID=1979401 RepID=UPI002882504C|nr:hypothetical protein [Thalassovita sp.]MDF1803193.1 hypothetical protein [Thalassovita sp.]
MTLKTPVSSIAAVNGHFLTAFLLGASAYWLWPSSPERWGFGLFSILLGFAALGKLIAALRAMIKIYGREKVLARLAATSRVPDPSDLADQNALKNAGMVDD